jgi:cellulose synthase/poly-beta-1,6-N-acetylglucosamine synthase-like glycosyltransferase
MIERTQRSGKAAALNAAVPQLSGEIVMFSDANTSTQPDAARRLVRWFQDPHVGVVCGKLVLTDPATGRNVDGLYWKYETQLKRYEGSLGALLGANGGIYAVRRSLIAPIPEGTIVDDLVLPLQAKLRSGCAIVFDKQAIAHEESAADVRAEFRRRTRIGAGGFQSIALLAGLLDPRRGWICFTFLSHKVLRWLCPFFLIGMLAGNLVLCGEPAYRVLLAFQAAFYLAALAAAYVPGRSPLLRILRLGTMFTSMNAALLVGFWRWLRGSQKVTWQRTARLAETTSASGV